MYFTKEELEYLSDFESNFNRAIKYDYIRNFNTTQVKKLLEIYKKIEPNYTMCMHCSSAILQLAKDIAKCYFADLAEIENSKKKNKKSKTKE